MREHVCVSVFVWAHMRVYVFIQTLLTRSIDLNSIAPSASLIYGFKYRFTQLLYHGQDMTKGQLF